MGFLEVDTNFFTWLCSRLGCDYILGHMSLLNVILVIKLSLFLVLLIFPQGHQGIVVIMFLRAKNASFYKCEVVFVTFKGPSFW